MAGVGLVSVALAEQGPIGGSLEWALEGPGSDTPEEAVLLYLEGLKEQNLEKMISAYALETYVDRFDLAAQLKRMHAYTPSMVPRVPNASPLLRSLNIEARRSQVTQAVLWQLHSLCMPAQAAQDPMQPISFSGENIEQDIDAFVAGLEAAYTSQDFSTLNVLRFIPPEGISELYASERNQQNLAAQAAPYGIDELRSVVAVFTVGDRYAGIACDVARYGDRWYMHNPSGNIASIWGLSSQYYGVISGSLQEMTALLSELNLGTVEELFIDQVEGH
jgi:hypothetical protein